MCRRVVGRPVLPRLDLAAQRRRAMSRCQRRIVSGVTSSRSLWRRAFGITLSRAASSARSAQFRSGRRGCCRCRTASWWRRIKISAVCHASSCRDSCSHEATRVIRRKTNRRHMTGDHHGWGVGRATLLVRAVDAILGTHNRRNPAAGGPRRGHRVRADARPGRGDHRLCRRRSAAARAGDRDSLGRAPPRSSARPVSAPATSAGPPASRFTAAPDTGPGGVMPCTPARPGLQFADTALHDPP